MVNIVVDSSVLIQNLRLGKEMYFGIIGKAKLGEMNLTIPSVVVMEIWSGASMTDKKKEKNIEKRLLPFEIIDINVDIAKKAGVIRRNYGVSGIDALIAATAVIHDAELVTLNTKHFVGIREVKLYNPGR